ncbi:MAG: Maf family protein, partial [bacterium]
MLLASSSPRRKALLSRLGIPFSAQGYEADETIEPGTAPDVAVRDLAVRKLRHVPERDRWDYILTADTVVCSPLDGRILGKPVDPKEAEGFLQILSGRQHRVLTGVCLYSRQRGTYSVEHAETAVEVSPLS